MFFVLTMYDFLLFDGLSPEVVSPSVIHVLRYVIDVDVHI